MLKIDIMIIELGRVKMKKKIIVEGGYPLLNKRKLVGFLTLLLVLTVGIFFSYSRATLKKQESVADATLKVGTLSYTMTINNSSTTAYTVESYKTMFLDVVITSNNPIDTKYELLYSIASPYSLISDKNCQVSYFSDQDPSSGIIPANGTKRIRIRIFNNTGDIKSLTFQTRGSLMNDNVELGQTQRHITRIASPYEEDILNGTDPVLSSNLVPVNIANDGTVTKASVYDNWYCYERQRWANAVVLVNKANYSDDQIIPESNIESYFVWIPRYRYQIFNTGNYSDVTSISSTAVKTINVTFENKNTAVSNGSSVNAWLTHPAFTSFNSNGFWVGKFESGYKGATSTAGAEQNNNYNVACLVIKPNTYSWRNLTLGNMFKASYDYLRSDDSHMMKNTEWGAIAYLQHSVYGSKTSVRINNNNSLLTGYAAVSEPTCGRNESSSSCNPYGTSASVTQPYNTTTGYLASTTKNITGVYDMSGGSHELVMGYNTSATTVGGSSGLTSLYSDFFTNSKWNKYYDRYTSSSQRHFNNRILGDATGEMGPFGSYTPTNSRTGSWYSDYSFFLLPDSPFFIRGGRWFIGNEAGIFSFSNTTGEAGDQVTFRVVLTPQ